MSSVEDGKISGMESAAVALLRQAVDNDKEGKRIQALTCYTEAISILMDVKKVTADDTRKENLDKRLMEYLNRAEKLKMLIDKEKKSGKYRETHRIANGSTGYSYQRLFKYLLDDQLTSVTIEDPYVRLQHQLHNLLRFVEMLADAKQQGICTKLEKIHLITGKQEGEGSVQQDTAMQTIRGSLKEFDINFKAEYSTTLHDREIKFDNGWLIKIGRGLDYFKPVNKFQVGFCNMDLRPCHETTIDIFHSASISS